MDNKCLIEELLQKDILLIGKCEVNMFLERLIRDIGSGDLKTRQSASEVLCYFIESTGSTIELNILTNSIWQMVERLAKENDYDVEQKLSEGIFEFIWLERLNEIENRNLITHLAKLDKNSLICYLDEEDYMLNEEVREFINRRRK